MSSFRKPVYRERLSPGIVNEDGTITDGSVIESGYIQASVQPLNGEDLQSLQELRRASKAYALYTDSLINTVREANPDRFLIGSEWYEAALVEPWQNNVINHYRVVAIKIEDQYSAEDLSRQTANGEKRVTTDGDVRIAD